MYLLLFICMNLRFFFDFRSEMPESDKSEPGMSMMALVANDKPGMSIMDEISEDGP